MTQQYNDPAGLFYQISGSDKYQQRIYFWHVNRCECDRVETHNFSSENSGAYANMKSI